MLAMILCLKAEEYSLVWQIFLPLLLYMDLNDQVFQPLVLVMYYLDSGNLKQNFYLQKYLTFSFFKNKNLYLFGLLSHQTFLL